MPVIEPTEAPADALIELPSHSRLPRLDLGIDWESPWEEFRSSWHNYFDGAPVPCDEELPQNSDLRALWLPEKFSVRAFVASTLWHVAVISLLVLPIWGFLPKPAQNLAPVRIELSWYGEPQDLPPISLPAGIKAPRPAPVAPAAKAEAPRGADAFHPRQTILSEPVRVTHPRQTLIQPAAPPEPPKIVLPLPNIVQWAASPAPPEPKLRFSPSTSTPRMERRAVREVAAPEIENHAPNSGPLNIAAAPMVNPEPRMPMAPMTASTAAPRRSHSDASASPAPEIGANSPDNPDMQRIVALSASPAPPAPVVNVPQGNLAARIAISPEGTRAGTPRGTSEKSGASAAAGSNGGAEREAASAGSGSGNSASPLPAAISVSRGSERRGGGGITPARGLAGSGLILRPMTPIPSLADPAPSARKGPADVSHLDPSLPPEALLSGKEIFTLHVNLPNLTSVSGSWIMHFAQLDEDDPPYKSKGVLSGPEPIRKVDPEYPQNLIKEHVDGEVVLYAIIRKTGSVDSIQLVRSLDPVLDRNSMEALSKWKFKPAMRDGQPIDVEAVVHIPFEFRKPD